MDVKKWHINLFIIKEAMKGFSTIQYYWQWYKSYRKSIAFSEKYQARLYNWFPPFFEQDLWIPRFIEGKGLLKKKPKIKAGVFTICGPEWAIKYQPCDLKIFFARENLSFRKEWHDFMLNAPCLDLSIGFDNITDNDKYIHVPFWVTWALEPDETYESVKQKVALWNSANNKSYADRRYCSFLCSHGDSGREMILSELSNIGKVDSCGRWMHNDDSLKAQFADIKVDWLKNYRFNLTPENSNAKGYVTEKLLEAIQGGCIPIYWGSNNCPDADVFNQDAIIFFNMGEKNSDVISLVAELNSDESKYMDFACQKRFVDGAEDVIWGYYERLENKLREIINNL